MHKFLKAWRDWRCKSRPFVLDGDEILRPRPDSLIGVAHKSWEAFIKDPEFGESQSRLRRSFHLDLIPVPFAGDLRHAKIVVLLLNPGLDPADYFGEFKFRAFRQRLLDNLRQDFRCTNYPFLYLDPAISWHSGYRWWHGKFQGLIGEIAKSRGIDYSAARNYLSKKLASVELVPYHSFTYGFSEPLRGKLHSSKLACDYVHDVLLPRSKADEILIVVTRRARDWKLKKSKNIVIYSGSETRAAHLTPNSSGGKRILEFLRDHF